MIHIFDIYQSKICRCNLLLLINVFSEPSPDSGRDKITVGAAGLLLGLVFSVAGLIYYKKKSSGERFFLINIKQYL